MELDRVVRQSSWFELGYRAGPRVVRFSTASAGPSSGPAHTRTLVSELVSVAQSGGFNVVPGPCGEGSISDLICELSGPPPDLRTLWVSFRPNAPRPKPFAELVGAALMDLIGAKAVSMDRDGPLDLVQRAFGSDADLGVVIPLGKKRRLRLSSAGFGTVTMGAPRKALSLLALEDAILEVVRQHGSDIDPLAIELQASSRNNRRLGTGSWVDRRTMRRLLVAAFVDAMQRFASRTHHE